MIVVVVVLGYLGGSVSFPYWIARLYGVDLRSVGSRKLGGSNLGRSVGLVPGIVGGTLDGAKGLAAILASGAAGLPLEAQLACGIAATCGQLWPAFHGFDGGRANATGWGFALATDQIAFLIMMVPVVAAVALRLTVRPRPSRIVPLANLLSFAVFPTVIVEQLGPSPVAIAGYTVLVLVIVRRVTAGLGADLATGAPVGRVIANRVLYDRSELQERGVVGI